MEKVIETWVAFQAHMFVARNNERGQGTLEYVGMVIVAAIVVLLVTTVAKDADLDGGFTRQIDAVLGEGE